MTSKVAMPTLSLGLAFCLSLTFTPLGCGGTQDPGYRPALPTPEGPTAPEATVAQLTDCTKQGASRLTETHYAILFDVHVTEGDDVRRVETRDSTIGDREIEACMVRALEVMSLPSSITAMRSSQPVSRTMTAESRAPMGNILVASGGAVTLIPIVIVVLGVTFLVSITVQAVADETAEAVKKRPKKIDEACNPPFYQCLGDKQQPEWNRNTFGDQKNCLECLWQCRDKKGQWPDVKCPRPGYRPN